MNAAQHHSTPTLSLLLQQTRTNGDLAAITDLLCLALKTSAYQPEAQLWIGINRMQQGKPADAFLSLACAIQKLPQHPEPLALLVKSLRLRSETAMAKNLVTAALQRFPAASILRQLYWEICAETMPHEQLADSIRVQLADVHFPSELQQLLKLLALQPQTAGPLGVVRFNPDRAEITGWAIDLAKPETTPQIVVKAGRDQFSFPADAHSPLLAQAGFPATHGGILIRLPQPVEALHIHFLNGNALIGSPLAAIPVFVPPEPNRSYPPRQPVDILVPVFKGYDATLECLESLLRCQPDNHTAHKIIVLDDASPDIRLVKTLKKMARQGTIQYLRRPANLGFIRNMNRGMALHPERDVVWLNADTRVHGDWLDRLHAIANQSEDIASVTPFSNNGELMSFPASRVCHPMPNRAQHARIDQQARLQHLAPVEIEVGCGFCLFIKRKALEAIGYLDECELQRGYGEETDWCLRARSLGWKHMGATNTFVAHAGGHSFGAEKALRVFQNNAILRRRYPDAERRYDLFVAHDPLAPARQALQNALPEANKPAAKPDDVPPVLTPNLTTLPGQCWLIADPLTEAALGQRWLQLARHLARQQHPINLLLAQDTPWEVQLLATGKIVRLPQLDGLSPAETLRLCGTSLALSLDDTRQPTAKHPWHSLNSAHQYELPLFAPIAAGLADQGANDLADLQTYLPQFITAATTEYALA